MELANESVSSDRKGKDVEDGNSTKGQMEINAVLSLGQESVEDSYVREDLISTLFSSVTNKPLCEIKAGRLHLIPPFLTFASVDRKSVRFTLPLCTVRRVERLNTRTGVFALSLLVWHNMKIVRRLHSCFLSWHECSSLSFVWNYTDCPTHCPTTYC